MGELTVEKLTWIHPGAGELYTFNLDVAIQYRQAAGVWTET